MCERNDVLECVGSTALDPNVFFLFASQNLNVPIKLNAGFKGDQVCGQASSYTLGAKV